MLPCHILFMRNSSDVEVVFEADRDTRFQVFAIFVPYRSLSLSKNAETRLGQVPTLTLSTRGNIVSVALAQSIGFHLILIRYSLHYQLVIGTLKMSDASQGMLLIIMMENLAQKI
jgi:hypothetical protein